MELSAVGRSLVVIGIVVVLIGLALMVGGRIPFLGRLPGDIQIGGEHWSMYAPIATSIVLSVALTLVLSLVGWLATRR
ncbi:MAG: DUF2905 domain-containing protein [Chloroflexota bacterium]|nr:DUF2905 domain-containing protein [Chloroflexota bacterium]MDE3192697.1 DUF2905 domain-containing protein [Chloroflexota bacterium]